MHQRGFLAGLLVGATIVAGTAWLGSVEAQGALPLGEAARGLALSPVRLNLRGKNRIRVGRGSYIVNAQGGCNDCHTNPSYAAGGDPFTGQPARINTSNYLAGGMRFGPFVSRNLTPDGSGRPAGLTLREFVTVMRTGRPPSGELLQVMPWPVFGNMTDSDLRDVYEFLTTIPPASPGETGK
jgi:hypothetical protein